MEYDLRYSLTNPPRWRRPWDRFYGQFLDQVEWADANGFDRVHLSEHHFTGEGWCPAPLSIAAAVAARTRRIRISVNLTLLTLKHPVQLAEEAAVVDNLSGGRLSLVLGAGYRPEEFTGYGISIHERGARMDEAFDVLRRCWSGETFDHDGRFWQLSGVMLNPLPVQDARDALVLGGSTPVAARRAARLNHSFTPVDPELLRVWHAEMLRLGHDPGPDPFVWPNILATNILFTLFVSADPQATWAAVAPHVLLEENAHNSWVAVREKRPHREIEDPEELRRDGSYRVLTPEEAVLAGREIEAADRPGLRRFVFEPMKAALPYEIGQESLELAVREVMPELPRVSVTRGPAARVAPPT